MDSHAPAHKEAKKEDLQSTRMCTMALTAHASGACARHTRTGLAAGHEVLRRYAALYAPPKCLATHVTASNAPDADASLSNAS